MQYRDVMPIDRQTADKAFSGNDEMAISQALLSLALHDPDWKWVQGLCLQFAQHPNILIRQRSAQCLGHLARIHGQLDLLEVKDTLQKLKLDPSVAGYAQDALDDIEVLIEGRS